MAGYNKNVFLKFWGANGYREKFEAYTDLNDSKSLYNIMIKPFENESFICLEIGCGGGMWTNILADHFKEVIAIDVIPRSPLLKKDIIYQELEDYDYSCSPIKDESIDFVFSFGVFCHLPVSAQFEYIKNIKRVLRHEGNAVIVFANWDSHLSLKNIPKEEAYKYKESIILSNTIQWFYMDENIIEEIMKNNDIKEYKDLIPGFRDKVIQFKKE